MSRRWLGSLPLIILAATGCAAAQEAESGLEFHGSLSALLAESGQLQDEPRSGAPVAAGVRAMLYGTWKINNHWSFESTVEIHSRPYFYEELETQGYGVRADILKAHLTYALVGQRKSLVVRAGALSTAFGSFLQRYDDSVNPLIDVPLTYGYYGRGITEYSLMGAQADITLGKLDARAQFVNSSPANRRSVFDSEQFGNWAGGLGWTISQGFRLGISAYRGPYLDRHSPFFSPNEVDPHRLPASAYGIDGQWGRGPWNIYGELQRFQAVYRAIPDFNLNAGYVEVRRVLNPRWYAAARFSYQRSNFISPTQVYEVAAGFRPSRYQLLKVGYEIQHAPDLGGSSYNVFGIQLVSTLPSWTLARN